MRPSGTSGLPAASYLRDTPLAAASERAALGIVKLDIVMSAFVISRQSQPEHEPYVR
jgi:hypothetical protein